MRGLLLTCALALACASRDVNILLSYGEAKNFTAIAPSTATGSLPMVIMLSGEDASHTRLICILSLFTD